MTDQPDTAALRLFYVDITDANLHVIRDVHALCDALDAARAQVAALTAERDMLQADNEHLTEYASPSLTAHIVSLANRAEKAEAERDALLTTSRSSTGPPLRADQPDTVGICTWCLKSVRRSGLRPGRTYPLSLL